MSHDFNSTSSPTQSPGSEQTDTRDEYLARWEIAVLTSIFLITLIGNVLVLLALYVRRRYQRRKFTRMHFFILHLSIADLLTGLLNVLPQLAWDITFRFQGGAVLCKLIKFGQPFGLYLSSYILTVTAMDRYYAICHPFSYCGVTSRRSKMMVYGAWVLAAVLCVPQVFIFSYQKLSPNVWDCWATFHEYGERAYVTWYSVTQFLLPFIVLTYTYTRICISIWASNKMSGVVDFKKSNKASFSQRNRDPFISKALINTVKQTIIVVTLHIVTSTPFIGSVLWAAWDPKGSTSLFVDGAAFTILSLLNSLTSCVNPWIYFAFNGELRVALTNFFCKRKDYSLAYATVCGRSTSYPRTNTAQMLEPRDIRLTTKEVNGARQFSTSFLIGVSMDDAGVNDEVPFVLDRVTIGMERNSEDYRGEPLKNESENESNDEDYSRSPVLLDLDENSKQQQQKAARREASSPSAAVQDQRLQDQLTPGAPDETTTTITLTTRPQPLRSGRWQEGYESARQQNPEGVLVIRVPEPEIIGNHSQLEMLHETNIKSVQQEPASSQTEKGAAISNCASPGELTSILDSTNLSISAEESARETRR